MLCVATVLLAFVAVSGARPSLEWGWLSRRKKLSLEKKLKEWRMKDGGRFSGRCSFWGASWRDGKCTCQNEFLTEPCLLPEPPSSFSPTELLEFDPNGQLWAVNCKCGRSWSKYSEEPLSEDGDLLRIAAVDFCAALLKNFDEMYHLKGGAAVPQARERVSSSKCVKSLEDVEKAKIAKGNGSMNVWQTALRHVCHEECEEIVHEMKWQTGRILLFSAGDARSASYSEACSIFVVRKVESHILGCCGDSCGWDGAKCASARFQASALSKFLELQRFFGSSIMNEPCCFF